MTVSAMTAALLAHIDSGPIDASADEIFIRLSRLLASPAPSSGCRLPGAIGEGIRSLANEWGLPLSDLASTGNLAIEIGADKSESDLVMTAHMDRPSFRVLSLAEGRLYPLCAIRIPRAEYVSRAQAVRYQNERLTVTARGKMHIKEIDGGHHIHFQAESGALGWGDTVLMDAIPQRRGSHIIATGLDNAAGVLLALLSARVLHAFAADLARQQRKILILFTDQEEGPPMGLFGQGAARLSHALPPPRLGFINIDAHNADSARGHIPGVGASHAFVSGRGRGSVVPLDYQALADCLAQAVNQRRPNTVRLNYGYVSRSDDMLLSLWSRCLALIGVPLAHAHTAEETLALDDIASALYWISAFVSQALEVGEQRV